MNFYEQWVLPHLVNWSMRQETFSEYRSRVLAKAEGRVLEIGIGSGLNLPHYGDAVRHVIGLEPSPTLLRMAQRVSTAGAATVELVQGSASSMSPQATCRVLGQ